jgi:DNA-binding transcriptional LysR family regulator
VVDLNEMAVFAQVVRQQSFTVAARVLGLPKSTVSQRVARLEARLGARLLHRTTRRVLPTETGVAYYERCSRILAEAEQADAAVSEIHGALRGRVRLVAPHLFGYTFLPGVLAEFLRAHPEVELDVRLSDRHLDLVAEGYDLGVRIGAVSDAALVVRQLGSADHVLCASPRYVRERGLPRTPGDLAAHDFVRYGGMPVPGTRWRLERSGVVEPVSVRGRLTVGSVVLARQAALDGLGIASLPRFACSEDLLARRLLPVLEGWVSLRVPIRLVYPSRRHLPARVRALADLLAERCSALPAWTGAPPRKPAA